MAALRAEGEPNNLRLLCESLAQHYSDREHDPEPHLRDQQVTQLEELIYSNISQAVKTKRVVADRFPKATARPIAEQLVAAGDTGLAEFFYRKGFEKEAMKIDIGRANEAQSYRQVLVFLQSHHEYGATGCWEEPGVPVTWLGYREYSDLRPKARGGKSEPGPFRYAGLMGAICEGDHDEYTGIMDEAEILLRVHVSMRSEAEKDLAELVTRVVGHYRIQGWQSVEDRHLMEWPADLRGQQKLDTRVELNRLGLRNTGTAEQAAGRLVQCMEEYREWKRKDVTSQKTPESTRSLEESRIAGTQELPLSAFKRKKPADVCLVMPGLTFGLQNPHPPNRRGARYAEVGGSNSSGIPDRYFQLAGPIAEMEWCRRAIDGGWAEGSTLLHFARSPDIVQNLLERGAGLSARANNGYSPMQAACCLQSRCPVQVSALLCSGGSLQLDLGACVGLDSTEAVGTPLHLACVIPLKESNIVLRFGRQFWQSNAPAGTELVAPGGPAGHGHAPFRLFTAAPKGGKPGVVVMHPGPPQLYDSWQRAGGYLGVVDAAVQALSKLYPHAPVGELRAGWKLTARLPGSAVPPSCFHIGHVQDPADGMGPILAVQTLLDLTEPKVGVAANVNAGHTYRVLPGGRTQRGSMLGEPHEDIQVQSTRHIDYDPRPLLNLLAMTRSPQLWPAALTFTSWSCTLMALARAGGQGRDPAACGLRVRLRAGRAEPGRVRRVLQCRQDGHDSGQARQSLGAHLDQPHPLRPGRLAAGLAGHKGAAGGP